ncbi:MAG: hypothetical protein KC413_21765 [Anaerolineales bacterium]|nr:hypothetical protein [Anaerolineales bacterium]
MTSLLQQAFAQAENLPEWEQDALAAFILEEIAASYQWNNPSKQAKRPSNKIRQSQTSRQIRRIQLAQN